MSGRPQTYVGALEDFRVEAQSIGHDLATMHDPREWGELAAQSHVLSDALDRLGFDHPARHLVERALGLNYALQVRDVEENRLHRVLARGEAAAS